MFDVPYFSLLSDGRADASSESKPPRRERSFCIPAAKLLAGFDATNGFHIQKLTADRGCIRNNGDGTYTLLLRPGVSGTIRLSYSAANDNVTMPAVQIVSVASAGDKPAMMTDGTRLSMIWPEPEKAMREPHLHGTMAQSA